MKELFLREDIFGAIPGFLSWSKWSKELLTIFEVFEISLDLFRELVMQGRRKNSEEAVDCFVGEPQAPASPFGLSGLSG